MLLAGLLAGILGLCIILVPFVLLVVLQVWLCKKNVCLGFILPSVSLVLSLILVFGMSIFNTLSISGNSKELVVEQNGQVVDRTVTDKGTVTIYGKEGNITDQYSDSNYEENQAQSDPVSLPTIAVAGVMLLVFNFPTLVFGGIWIYYKKRLNLQDDLRKMRIDDLG